MKAVVSTPAGPMLPLVGVLVAQAPLLFETLPPEPPSRVPSSTQEHAAPGRTPGKPRELEGQGYSVPLAGCPCRAAGATPGRGAPTEPPQVFSGEGVQTGTGAASLGTTCEGCPRRCGAVQVGRSLSASRVKLRRGLSTFISGFRRVPRTVGTPRCLRVLWVV